MQFSIQPLFDFRVLVIGLVAALVFTLFFLREKAELTRGQRITLALIRLSLLGLVAIALLKPGVSFTKQTAPEGSISVMIDRSMSMQLPAGAGTESRWEVARELAQRLANSTSALPDGTSLKLFTFDAQLRKAGREDTSTERTPVELNSQFSKALNELELVPTGPTTDLGGPLRSMIDESTDPPLQAVVWLSDGVQTVEESRGNPRQVARQLAEANIPLYLVGIGPRTGSTESLDQWVDTVPEQVDAFAKNVVNIRGLLKSVGLANRDLKISAKLLDREGKQVKYQEQTLTPNRSEQTLPISFPIAAPAKGAYEIVIQAQPIDGEATLLNNQQTTFLNVRESGSRVLYIEGEPRFEQKFIRLALSDSKDLQIDHFPLLQNTSKQWPINGLATYLADDTYDCIILGDVDSRALGDKTMQALVKRVEEGAGLILLGGYHAYGPGGYEATPLNALLPVNIAGAQRQNFDQPPIKQNHHAGPLSIQLRRRHPIFEFGNQGEVTDEALVNKWKGLPALLGANKVGAMLPKPGVQLLADSIEGKQPLIVASGYDKGRVLMLTFDSSYVWWRGGESELHKRFWRQAVLWAMQSQDREPGLKVMMEKRRVRAGNDAKFRVEWTGPNANDPLPEGLTVVLKRFDDVERPLLPNQREPMAISGTISTLLDAGRYQVIASVTGPDGLTYEDRLPFDVVDDPLELIRATPDWQLMNQLAELNERAGGRVIPPDQFNDLLSLLRERAKSISVTLVESHYLGDGPIDSWALFLIVAALLALQWALRKRWSLA